MIRPRLACTLIASLWAAASFAQIEPQQRLDKPVAPSAAPGSQPEAAPAPVQPVHQNKPDQQPPESDLDQLVKFMVGSFSSQEQSKLDPEGYFDIRLHMVQIWRERTDGRWLYVEQASAAKLDKPYRQRIYRLHETKPGEFTSEVYEFQGDPLQYAGAFMDLAKLQGVTPDNLVARDGCQIVLHHAEDGTFRGATQGTGCVSSLRGAAYATSEAIIGPDGLRTWDRGYDKEGKQVWGAEKGPYDFRRVE